MATTYLALGSNVGDSKDYIEQAVRLLGDQVRHIERAPLYRSKAVGYTDQANFLNTVLSGETKLSPRELLAFIKTVEQKVGRTESFRWGPRRIDVDIIFYDGLKLETEELTLPHPLFRERDFVLRPIHDLDPALIDPKTGQTIAQLLDKIASADQSILKQVD